MSYWCDDARLDREQRRLDAEQERAALALAAHGCPHPVGCPWRNPGAPGQPCRHPKGCPHGKGSR